MRESTIEKAQKAGFGTSVALAALHDMPHDSELFQDLLTDVPFDYNWNEEASTNVQIGWIHDCVCASTWWGS